MKPLLLISSAALLGSQAFAWIALLPSFHFQCRATALAPLDGSGAASSSSSSSPICRRFEASAAGSSALRHNSNSGSSSSGGGGGGAMGGVGGAITKLNRGGATAAINRARSAKGVAPLEVAAAATATAASSSSSHQILSSSSSSEDNQSEASSLLHQQIGGGGGGNLVTGAGGEDDDRRTTQSRKYLAMAAYIALAAGTAMSVVPGPQGTPSMLSTFLKALKPAEGTVLTGKDLYWRIFLAGGICASASHAGVVPMDVVKTRLQTHPEVYQGLGIWGAFEKISREEGPKMLMKGLGATLVGYSIQGSLKYGLYAIFKAVVKNALPGSSIFVNYIMASIMADVIASTALCPLEATRIRLVADPKFAPGTFDALWRLVDTEGWGSIYKGMPAILAKQLPYTIVQLCGFELITRVFYSWDVTAAFLLQNPGPWGKWLVSFGSALITAIFASLASQPGDVILSRVNKDKSDKPVLLTMKETVQGLGVKGLFRGTRARLIHVGLIVTIQLVIYDFVKQLVGLPATGAH